MKMNLDHLHLPTDDQLLRRVNYTKFLRVMFDEKLEFSQHVNYYVPNYVGKPSRYQESKNYYQYIC